ncbi:DUF2290 domain-containing protein [Pediococcus damnosus]|uniref:DUF2290 domain-containing protein n=1 Tax=Pediococcus damnosus TaxID=51663 RepID=UPI001143BBF0|nr:DUF2290 domain-containing protein [Pediococcus damnosus]GEA93757.1 hypothetical protein PDA01_16500 [Pediococcus damnosus]
MTKTNTPKKAKLLIKQINSIIQSLYEISLCTYSPMISTSMKAKKNGESQFNIEFPNLDKNLFFANISYEDMWEKMNCNKQYTCKLVDGGLLTLLYTFSYVSGEMVNSRLSFFPCYETPSLDDCPNDYDTDITYLDVFNEQSYPSAIRFDYDPSQTAVKDIVHPSTHLTLGQFEHCRIPLQSPLTPLQFFSFIIRNFYNSKYSLWQSQISSICYKDLAFNNTISINEQKIVHLAW